MSDFTKVLASPTQVTIVGAGFAGLACAYKLALSGQKVCVLEAEPTVGGLAGAFDTNGERLDRFYHHWFTNDFEIMELIEELELSDQIVTNPTNTGVFYANKIFKLSTPMDLLKFSALPFWSRLRLGFMTLRVRSEKDWMRLEKETATSWLKRLGGETVFKVVWQPLLQGKFGPYADSVSAVWFWNKLKLRGASRGKGGEEKLAYFKGSFATLAEALASKIEQNGGEIRVNSQAETIEQTESGKWQSTGSWGTVESDKVVVTTSLPLIAGMISSWAEESYIEKLNAIDYLANVCLVLRLDRSLSSTYWLNVNDTKFPFVGVIEHTNFESPSTYAGDHIVYLSRYLPHTDDLYQMDEDEVLAYSMPYLKQMFPEFQENWIRAHHVWRARWSQPVVGLNYSSKIPDTRGPKDGFYICSMAQIYPEDRGTNYAVREGKKLANEIIRNLGV